MVQFIAPEDYDETLTHATHVVRTAVGWVEYALAGDGPPLLSVHGTPGGCDQGWPSGCCSPRTGSG